MEGVEEDLTCEEQGALELAKEEKLWDDGSTISGLRMTDEIAVTDP